MTTEVAKVSQVSQINCGTFGSSQFTDLIMTNLIYSKLGDCFKDNFKLSLANIGKLLLLMSVNELKGYFGDLLRWLIAKSKDSPMSFYLATSKLVALMRRFQRSSPVIKSTPDPPITPSEISLDVDTNFLLALYQYLLTHSACSYRKTLAEIELKNAKEQYFTESFDEIVVVTPTETFTVPNQLKIKIKTNVFNGEHVAAGIEQMESVEKSGPADITSYLDLLTEKQREVIMKLKSYYRSGYPNSDDLLRYLGCGRDVYLSLSKSNYNFTEMHAAQFLLTRYPKLDETETVIEVVLVTSQLLHHPNRPLITSTYLQRGYLYCDPHNKYTNLPTPSTVASAFISSNRISDIANVARSLGYSDPPSIFKSLLERPTDSDASSQLGKKNQLILRSNTTKPITSSMVQKFITEIYKCAKQRRDKVKIFYLTLQTEIKTSEVPNPDYTQWEQKRDLLDKMKADPKVFAELIIPPKTIPKETAERKIEVKQLNEIEKDIDTLYLRKADKEILVSCLSQFRDKKEVIRSLGLPNKLNILLYGMPGTGKSTTIQAVATYLRKDIYYVDLKDAVTNADLQMIFEYVNKNVPNGGIVVIEDIDAMTEVVLKRTPLEPSSPLGRSSLPCDHKSKLTLDYFLNILQGTLTLDDSIFIVTTNHLTHLDPAFYRDGRFDVKVELKLCDTFQMNAIYHRILNRDIPTDLLKQLPEDKFSPAALIFHVKNYMFTPNMPDEEILRPFLAMN
jgi:hypothetical protein